MVLAEGESGPLALAPADLRQLIEQIKLLEVRSRPAIYAVPAPLVASKSFVGLAAKKQHEISAMVPFIRDICRRNGVGTVVDIGSGLVRRSFPYRALSILF